MMASGHVRLRLKHESKTGLPMFPTGEALVPCLGEDQCILVHRHTQTVINLDCRQI